MNKTKCESQINQPNIKLFISDMNGTSKYEDKIQCMVHMTYDELRAKGIKTCICTAADLANTLKEAKEILKPDILATLSGGALFMLNERGEYELIEKHPIDVDISQDIAASIMKLQLLNRNIKMHFSTPLSFYGQETTSSDCINNFNHFYKGEQYVENSVKGFKDEKILNMLEPDNLPCRLCIDFGKGEDAKKAMNDYESFLENKYKHKVFYINRSENILDITEGSVNKGQTSVRIRNHYEKMGINILPEETLVIGDGVSDISMLAWKGENGEHYTAICMGNSSGKVKEKLPNWVLETGNVREQGLARIILDWVDKQCKNTKNAPTCPSNNRKESNGILKIMHENSINQKSK